MTIGFLMTLGRDVAADRLGPYAAALPPIYAEYRGRYLALGGPGRGCDAFGGAPDRSLMLARFPSLEAVQAFWHCDAYRQAVPLRSGCGHFDVFAFAGPEPQSPVRITLVQGASAEPPLAPIATIGLGTICLEGRLPDGPLSLFVTDAEATASLDRWIDHSKGRGYRLDITGEQHA